MLFMNLKRFKLVCIAFFLIGIFCFVAYAIKGSYIATDGLLVEPFFLIPIGWFFIIMGSILSAVVAVTPWIRRKK